MSAELRPRELALLLLAATRRPPRERARDQKADRAGAELRRELLDRLIEADPEFGQLEAALLQIVSEMRPPAGPLRAIAGEVRDTLVVARDNPAIVDHLLSEAIHDGQPRRGGSAT